MVLHSQFICALAILWRAEMLILTGKSLGLENDHTWNTIMADINVLENPVWSGSFNLTMKRLVIHH